MSTEIERKFLVSDTSFISSAESSMEITQCYLSVNPGSTVRVRIFDTEAYLTIKSKNCGIIRSEWEYPIPVSDAREMIKLCAVSPVIEKTRYRLGRWEIDCFHGALEGLILAEIELVKQNEDIEFPPFVGREVSKDPRYYNSNLAFMTRIPD